MQVHTFVSNTAFGGASLTILEGVDSTPLMQRLLKVAGAAIAAAKEASTVKEEVEDDSVLEATNEVRVFARKRVSPCMYPASAPWDPHAGPTETVA